jgi:ATP adenylyltransferase/5',5'''-P-1,P-4-tetraphosphate phosphorylase II
MRSLAEYVEVSEKRDLAKPSLTVREVDSVVAIDLDSFRVELDSLAVVASHELFVTTVLKSERIAS